MAEKSAWPEKCSPFREMALREFRTTAALCYRSMALDEFQSDSSTILRGDCLLHCTSLRYGVGGCRLLLLAVRGRGSATSVAFFLFPYLVSNSGHVWA